MAQVRDWCSVPSAVMVNPTARHADVLSNLVLGIGSGGNLINDAHLAALAIEHRTRIVTYDNDFGRFDGVSWGRAGGTARLTVVRGLRAVTDLVFGTDWPGSCLRWARRMGTTRQGWCPVAERGWPGRRCRPGIAAVLAWCRWPAMS
jgi:hypothetical protein